MTEESERRREAEHRLESQGAGESDEFGQPIAPEVSRRVRVVLAEVSPKRQLRVSAEWNRLGEAQVRRLIRTQFLLAVRMAALMVLVFGPLPVAFLVFPAFSEATVFGIGVPWLVLGVGAYPVLLAIAWAFVAAAERNERELREFTSDRLG